MARQLEKQSIALKELQDKLSKNSQNSSKPPSSDGYTKVVKRTKSLRKAGQKSTGGQPGHKGETLKISENPNYTIIHQSDFCQSCQTSLKGIDPIGYEERQVFDIPAIQIEITAHHAEVKVCPKCGSENKGKFPDGVTQPTQYGKVVKSWGAYFTNQHFISLERTGQVFEDLVNHRVSEGTILKASEELSECVSPCTETVRDQLCNADVANFDESGVRVKGKLHWLHVVSTEQATHYEIHAKRGQEAIDECGVLNNFKGKAVHDHWKPYFKYKDCSHALCNAHHLRELQFIEERYEQSWAKEMAELLLEIKEAVEDSKQASSEADSLPPKQLIEFGRRYDEIVKKGFKANPCEQSEEKDSQVKKKSRSKQTPPVNLLIRLRDFKAETLDFMYDFRVPFDNNLAERDVRMVKVKQKVSGSFRTVEGAKCFGRIRSYISTVRKNSVNVFNAIKDAFCGNPFIPSIELQ